MKADIQAESAVRNIINTRALLGGEQRVRCRRMRGCTHHNAFSVACHRSRPRIDLEVVAIEHGGAAEMFPATDRDEHLKPELVCQFRDLDVMLVGWFEGRLGVANGAAVATIGAENAEFQPIVVVYRYMIVSPLR